MDWDFEIGRVTRLQQGGPRHLISMAQSDRVRELRRHQRNQQGHSETLTDGGVQYYIHGVTPPTDDFTVL